MPTTGVEARTESTVSVAALLSAAGRPGGWIRLVHGTPELAVSGVQSSARRRPDTVTAGSLAVVHWTDALQRVPRGRSELADRLRAEGAAGVVVPAGSPWTREPPDGLAVLDHDDDRSAREVVAELVRAHGAALDARRRARSEVLDAALAALALGNELDELVHAVGGHTGVPMVVLDRNGTVLATHEPAVVMEHFAATGQLREDGRVRLDPADRGSLLVPVLRNGEQVCTLHAIPSERWVADELRRLLAEVTPLLALALRASDGAGTDRHLARELVLDMISEDLTAREQAFRRAGRLGILASPPYAVIDVHPVGQNLGRAGPQRLAARLEPEVLAQDPRAVVVAHEGSVVAVMAASVAVDRLVPALRRSTPVPLSVGSSPPIAEVRGLPTALRRSRRAAQLGTRMPRPGGVTRYEDLGAFRLLLLLPEHERRTFVRETLRELASAGSDASELRRTLRTLLDENLNVARAARRLFVHYNTLRYRIERLERIVGPFVDDPDARLTLQVALALHRIEERDAEPLHPTG